MLFKVLFPRRYFKQTWDSSTYLVVGSYRLVRVLNIVSRSQDLLGLLDGVLDLAGDKQGGQGGVLVVVLGIAEAEAEAVKVDAGRVKGADGQLELLAHIVEELDALQAVAGLARRVAAVVGQEPPDGGLGGVLVRGLDVARVGADLGRRRRLRRQGIRHVVVDADAVVIRG